MLIQAVLKVVQDLGRELNRELKTPYRPYHLELNRQLKTPYCPHHLLSHLELSILCPYLYMYGSQNKKTN
jgi:hypothetical protein